MNSITYPAVAAVTAAVMLPNPSLLAFHCLAAVVMERLEEAFMRPGRLQFQLSRSLSLARSGCALMSAITCDIYSLMFAMVRVCGTPLPLPPPIAIRKFHMQMYPAGVEPGNGEWLAERGE